MWKVSDNEFDSYYWCFITVFGIPLYKWRLTNKVSNFTKQILDQIVQ